MSQLSYRQPGDFAKYAHSYDPLVKEAFLGEMIKGIQNFLKKPKKKMPKHVMAVDPPKVPGRAPDPHVAPSHVRGMSGSKETAATLDELGDTLAEGYAERPMGRAIEDLPVIMGSLGALPAHGAMAMDAARLARGELPILPAVGALGGGTLGAVVGEGSNALVKGLSGGKDAVPLKHRLMAAGGGALGGALAPYAMIEGAGNMAGIAAGEAARRKMRAAYIENMKRKLRRDHKRLLSE